MEIVMRTKKEFNQKARVLENNGYSRYPEFNNSIRFTKCGEEEITLIKGWKRGV